MKLVLLSLHGNEASARARLKQAFPAARIETVPREEIDGRNFANSLRSLRARRPAVLAISTENLAWQRGQNILAVFGVLAGAERIVLLDERGEFREETRRSVLLRAPKRLTLEAMQSWLAISQSRRDLRQLEDQAKKLSTGFFLSGTHASSACLPKPDIIFLRATPGPGTQSGGASTHINGFISAARAQGARIRVISNDRIADLDQDNIPVQIVPLQSIGLTRSAFDLRNNLVFTAQVSKEIKQSLPDLIYQRYSRFTWAGVVASLQTRRPLFLEYNGSEVWVGKHWDDAGMFPLLERFERLNLNAAARVFVVSEVERRNLLRAGVANEKIVVNPNGVDVEEFRPDIGGARVRAELGVGVEEVLVGFVGTYGPWHGVLELAQAITELPWDANIRFLLIGAGKLRGKVQRIVENAGMRDRVIFTGSVEHKRVPKLLDACDILVSPHVPLADGSDFFGSPTKLFEYLAMGKGIVASRLGQIADVLVDEETALLVEPGNARQLSDAILRLSRSRELRERLGAAARQAAVERHTWRRNAACVLDNYRQWIETNC